MIALSIAKKPKAKKARLASPIVSMKPSASTTAKPIAPIIQTATTLFVRNIARMQPIIAHIARTMPAVLATNAHIMLGMRILAPNSIARNTEVQWMLAAVNKSTIANNIVRSTLAATIQFA
jgi:hypothetical protein